MRDEAYIFDTFSSDKYRHMQQEWCGLGMVDGISVPVGPVVPKFYGYYVPEEEVVGCRGISPILRTEDCGSPVEVNKLSRAHR